jgi:hypothetical protein
MLWSGGSNWALPPSSICSTITHTKPCFDPAAPIGCAGVTATRLLTGCPESIAECLLVTGKVTNLRFG